jgi:hypothetical protein
MLGGRKAVAISGNGMREAQLFDVHLRILLRVQHGRNGDSEIRCRAPEICAVSPLVSILVHFLLTMSKRNIKLESQSHTC